MKTFVKLCWIFLFVAGKLFSQQSITGQITDGSTIHVNPVLIINISAQKSSLSTMSGKFTIDASENDEVRFVKEGYYRFEKKITKEDLASPLHIILKRMEIQIPEVEIVYKPTGNLAKDSKYLSESGKLKALKSDITMYMKSPLNEPIPDHTISKTFTGHDFNAGQVNVAGVFKAISGIIKKASKPKITKADYNETQNFLTRVKSEINLDFLKKYGMDEEQIDRFLLYANKTRMLAKNYRKDFQNDVVEYEIKVAFGEYRKLHKLDSWEK
ncbi:hypothetical protein [Chryseobacterium rhizosphaerae]|uniref:hypothetical protein n=1 Tax=Chryseobacterium rhizosphaerae TaxID=395937 RepID=UPI0023593F92|nr:hypothetical protein [Chryseobacterium rhizosphaerae]MDC8101897.1 hypothetical protein [Chryseobacterium rhizosphaerae]